jgi:hypothetical protein
MSARKKLNSSYVGGSLVLSGAIGLMTQSWAVFLVLLILLLAIHLYEGNIRPKKPDAR